MSLIFHLSLREEWKQLPSAFLLGRDYVRPEEKFGWQSYSAVLYFLFIYLFLD